MSDSKRSHEFSMNPVVQRELTLQLNYFRTYTRKTYIRRYLNWHRDTLHECTKVFLHRNRNVYLNFVRFVVPTHYVRAKLIRKQYFSVVVAELQIVGDHSCSTIGMLDAIVRAEDVAERPMVHNESSILYTFIINFTLCYWNLFRMQWKFTWNKSPLNFTNTYSCSKFYNKMFRPNVELVYIKVWNIKL